MTKHQRSARIPAALRRIVEKELDSHIRAHLDARHFGHIRELQSASAKRNVERQKKRPAIEAGLVVYGSNCASLARKGLREIRRLGWILLVRPFSSLAAQVDVEKKDGKYVVTRVSTGAAVLDLQKIVDRVREKAKRRPKSRTELQALRVPALHLLAVWVRHRGNSALDFFVPVSPGFSGISRGRSYGRTQVELRLKKRATEMIINWFERAQVGMNGGV